MCDKQINQCEGDFCTSHTDSYPVTCFVCAVVCGYDLMSLWCINGRVEENGFARIDHIPIFQCEKE